MTRKPGQPAEYLGTLYRRALEEQRMLPSPGEKHPEILAERVWESIIKKLLQKEYQFDTGFFGSLNEFSRKVAYFFHASLQGTACYAGAAAALRALVAADVPVVEFAAAQGSLERTFLDLGTTSDEDPPTNPVGDSGTDGETA